MATTWPTRSRTPRFGSVPARATCCCGTTSPRSWPRPPARLAFLLLSVQRPQLVLRRLQPLPAQLGQVLTSAIDVEGQHRHRRAIGVALAAVAVLRRTLQRTGDALGILAREDVGLAVERIALGGHVVRPPTAASGGHRRAGTASRTFSDSRMNAGMSWGCREETRLRSTTTSWSTTLAPAFFK